jgi:hypothetical protein
VLSGTTLRGAIRELHSKQREVYRRSPHVVDLSPSEINTRAESFFSARDEKAGMIRQKRDSNHMASEKNWC